MNTQFLNVSEGSIAYDDQGNGPLVVCVPGMGDLRAEFRYLVPQLVSAGYRVVTMDVRGHGESSVKWKDYSVAGIGSDIVDLIHQLDAGPAIVVGNSMAAGAAIWVAVEAPELVKALVLIGPAVHGDIGGAMRLSLGSMFARPWGPSAWLWYYSRLFPTHKPADWAEYTSRLKQNIAETGRLEALKQMMFASKAASEARLAKVRQPTFIVMGSRDPDFKDAVAEAKWVAGQVKADYQIIEGAGHYPHTEMPEITGPKITAFLKTLQTEANHEQASH